MLLLICGRSSIAVAVYSHEHSSGPIAVGVYQTTVTTPVVLCRV
jgi:hypothetical protein